MIWASADQDIQAGGEVMNTDRDELIAIVMEEATDNGVLVGTLTAEDIADAMIAAGFKRDAK